jgi:hypothetical protein
MPLECLRRPVTSFLAIAALLTRNPVSGILGRDRLMHVHFVP